ncbi:HET-domain-containing protein [Trematosphaeria pertusa]|uniref:HET-domain-containing protein n=1 Tax=Trematosphaeria pertusa TaxID=390896 RepID=A0A6A6IQH5_9PLEO|nr:HET-domain-containing protein [Trematosphaeria pertusa]KAF2252022.1 HET-domain-containing protein [Trematosphaeria pertusa]
MFISTDVIQSWLQTCLQLHGDRCGNGLRSDTRGWNGPLWLIDVEDGCLVAAFPRAKYVALSYVWGCGSISASTTNENFVKLQERGGLYDPSTVTLPRTIRDAIELVRSVGERYVWIDRFCIVQDEGPANQSQLNAMGNIYAGAYFTLVAAQGEDPTDGLYGKRPINLSSTSRPMSNTPPGDSSKEILLDQAMHLMRTKWYSRSWTFQEYLFSKRRVVFHNDTVNWECFCAAYHESQDVSTTTPLTAQFLAQIPKAPLIRDIPSTGFECSSWPDMFRYARLVSMFNRRNLSYPEDVLDAFAGLLSHLSRIYPGGFISGLPQMCFDAALLWQPWIYMCRRKSVKLSDSEAVLPSWSWAAWAGDLNSESWRSAANYLLEADDEDNPHQQCSWKTISTVKWFYSLDRTSARKEVQIRSEFARPIFGNTLAPLPSGWSAVANPNGPDRVLFHHHCDPSHPFRYPIPIRNQYLAHIPPISARFLHCTTRHALLKAGPTYQTLASSCPAIELLSEEERWVGVLRLNCIPSDFEDLIEAIRTEHGGRLELIEISAGAVENQPIEEKSFDEWNREGCPRHKGLYEFINVLWIEWVDGIAYRKALGRVEKGVWGEVAIEKLDITLG